MLPHESSDSARQQLARDLGAVGRRLRTRELLAASAWTLPAGALLSAFLVRSGVPLVGASGPATLLVAVAIGLHLARRKTAWSASAAAQVVERARSDSRNVVVTAEELTRHPDRARAGIRAMVFGRAALITKDTSASAAVPLARSAAWTACALALSILIVGWPAASTADVARAIREAVGRVSAGGSTGLTLTATIAPPPYAKQPERRLDDPERIEALQGSNLRLELRGGGPWAVRFGAEALAVHDGRGTASADLPLARSGYLAIEPRNGGQSGTRRLVPIVVVPDRAPSIRIEAPGKDLLLPDTKRVVSVKASAVDDLGLRSLELQYTKASGTGEQFEFQQGTMPLQISPSSGRDWNAQAAIALAKVGLEPGDSIIYRVVGRDYRPGEEGVGVSDTFFIEIAGPGQVALDGFEMPPEHERYALSQQMIVMKLERLRAREASLDKATLEEEVAGLAAEQRAVRANFIFLMGGHVEDEEEEAAHEHEIQEGRLENTARKEIDTAIQHMGRAEQGLVRVSTGEALPPARAAVEALQRAFGRNRYLLRTLPVRSRVDPSRRLTGELTEAKDWKRDLIPANPTESARVARSLLSRLVDLSPAIQNGSVHAETITALAEEALAVDPAHADWQAISKSVLRVRDGLTAATSERSRLLNDAASLVGAMVRRESLAVHPRGDDNTLLRGIWTEERRK